ncbi:hypothetical protein ACKXGF_13460 [Alkalibacillus sp. S2W]|uniref:hypothetical protein n=1 Tax=Alkalibacillus sp. S2W TaxID=3386553 RepID=UPI00398C9946
MGYYNCGKRIEVPGKVPIKPKNKKKKSVAPRKKQQAGCNCNVENPAYQPAKLTNDCTVVNSLLGTKTVQKVAELTLPVTAFSGLGVLDNLVSVNLTPNLNEITQNVRVIKDKVVNIGLLPATISVSILDVDLPVTLNTTLPFQEHTDFPGICPQDNVQETPLEVEGIFTQPGVPVIDAAGIELVDGILFKVILRTTITATRPVIRDAQGNVCDVNPNRCEIVGNPPSFNLPAPTNGGLLG